MSDIKIVPAELSDEKYLVEWLSDPDILRWFPMSDDRREIVDSARIWINYCRINAVMKALYKGEPCGIANLYIQPFPKLQHQCLFAIIVKKGFRGKGIGSRLIEGLIELGKKQFNIELLHLEVYEGNPAISLYKRFGFKQYGKQRRFLKEDGKYYDKILMQKQI